MVGSPSRSAGLKGTIVNAENLFHNCLARRRALKYPQEEAIRILDLLVKYSIEYPHVAFALRRLDAPSSDFCTLGNGDRSATVRNLLGSHVNKDLVDCSYTDNDNLKFSFRATFSAPVSSHTSTAIQARQDRYKTFHLFINGRSVDSPRMKQSIDLVFAGKNFTCQFINISLQIEPSRVDVNVHPTKAIVHFLNEDKIIEAIEERMFKALNDFCSTGVGMVGSAAINFNNTTSSETNVEMVVDSSVQAANNTNRANESASLIDATAPQQTKTAVKRPRVSDFAAPSSRVGLAKRSNSSTIQANATAKKIAGDGGSGGGGGVATTSSNVSTLSAQRVRVDASNRLLDEFLSPATKPSTTYEDGNASTRLVPISSQTDNVANHSSQKIFSRTFELDSLDNLRRAICRDVDESLTKLFRRHHFIGLYGNEGCGIFQVDESVYLVQLYAIVREFFYQLVIFSFGNMGSYRLSPPINENNVSSQLRVSDLLKLHYEANNITNDESLSHSLQTLVTLSELLWDYFSIGISAVQINSDDFELVLHSIPCIFDGFTPQIELLPELLFDLAKIDCTEEEKCFKEIAEALSKFFTPQMASSDSDSVDETCQEIYENANPSPNADLESLKGLLCRFVLPALKSKFLPSAKLRPFIRKITSIEVAFKKFGRC